MGEIHKHKLFVTRKERFFFLVMRLKPRGGGGKLLRLQLLSF